MITGRAFGKNRSAAEWVHSEALEHPRVPGFLAARTLGDVAKVMVGHPTSGLLATMRPENPCEITRRNNVMILEWANGAYAEFHSSEEPESSRGPHYYWGDCDEIGTWKRKRDFEGNTQWDNLGFALRGGKHPQMIVTSTPRPVDMIRLLMADAAKPELDVVLSTGSLLENAANIPSSYVDGQVRRYQDTRLYRQEIMGELLLDTEDAIITREMLDEDRVQPDEVPELQRVVVGCDPAVTSKTSSDRTGIIPIGLGVDGDAYILADLTCKMSPDGWRRRLATAYWDHNASLVIPENNNGGDLIELVLRDHDSRVRVKTTWSHEKKGKRFDHVCGYFEKGTVHIVGSMPELEDQLVQFVPGSYEGEDSPDNADAMVFALSELMFQRQTDWAEAIAVNSE